LLLVPVGFRPSADPTTLNPQVMRRLAFVRPPFLVLSASSERGCWFSWIDRRTHEANLALLEAGAPRFGLKASTVVEEPDERMETDILGYQRAENEQANPTEAGGDELLSRGRPATLQIVR
jgi:hypothetical protein